MGTVGFQPGFQFGIGSRSALITEIGFPLSGANNNNFDKVRFLRITSEVKLYRQRFAAGRFFSFQLGYLKRSFQDKDSGSFHNIGDTIETGYSSLKIKSPVFFGLVKLGREVVEWNKLFMDCFVGAGVRISPTKYETNGDYIRGPYFTPKDNMGAFIPIPSWKYNKTTIRPHLLLASGSE